MVELHAQTGAEGWDREHKQQRQPLLLFTTIITTMAI